MKKSIVIMWNHLQYIDQVKAMDKIAELIEYQTDETMRVALTAALSELEIWSNIPTDTVDNLTHDEPTEQDEEDIEKTWIH
jgi:hypothetical protein